MTNLKKIESVDDLKFLAKSFAKSNLFDTGKDAYKAITKVQMGQEMGLGPATSMSNVHVVDGKPSAGSHVYSAKVKSSDKYHYKVLEKNDEKCVLEWWEKSPITDDWEKAGTSEFTIEDAEQANLLHKNNWQNYPEDMCFARAITRGIRTHAPDLTETGAYVPDELGDDSFEGNEAEPIDEPEEAEDVQETEFEIDEGDTSDEDEQDDKPESEASEDESEDESDTKDDDITDDQLKKLNTVGSKMYELCSWKPTWDDKRPDLVEQVTDGRTDSSTELKKDEANDLIDNLEKQYKMYKKMLEQYPDNYKLAKQLAGRIDGITGKGDHGELIEKIESKIETDNESDEGDDDEEPEEDLDNVDF